MKEETRVYILLAEHDTVPGVHVTAHRSKKGRQDAKKKARDAFGKHVSFEEFETTLEA